MERKIHKRGLTSFFTLFGFLIMSITGLILYIVPQGRIAYWVNWMLGGLTKTDWGNIHIIFSVLFIVAGIFHIYFNWKPLINYFRDRVTRGVKLGRELAITLIVSVILIVSSVYMIPPVSYLLDLNEYIKDAWIVSQDYEPPYGHAEETALNVFTKKVNIDLDLAVKELKSNGITFDSPALSLQEIAELNNVSPMDIYSLIKKFEPRIDAKNVSDGFSAEEIELKFTGTGLGNRTLETICEKVGIELDEAKERMSVKGIVLGDNEVFKDAAERYDVDPMDLLKAILVDDYILEESE